jgi:hypothetical protein
MESKLRPKVVLRWGIGLTIAGVLVTLLLPQLAYTAVQQPSSAADIGQGLVLLVDLLTRVIAQVLAPLGVALIGAAVVMSYVARLLAPAAANEDRRTIEL